MRGLRNGGPAFPGVTINDTDGNLTDPFGTLLPPQGQATYSGMSLRDYFAACAMQGLVVGESDAFQARHSVATEAYAIADAMMKERAK